MRHRAWLVMVGALAGCAFEPTGAVPMETPAVFTQWWARTEACSAQHGDLARLEFYVVPGDQFSCPTGQCVGRWEEGHKIYLAERWAADELVVRHEMLHELLGKPGHPNPPFGKGCPLTWSTWNSGNAEVASGRALAID